MTGIVNAVPYARSPRRAAVVYSPASVRYFVRRDLTQFAALLHALQRRRHRHRRRQYIRCESKNTTPNSCPYFVPNINRFSKFFHC